MAEHNGCRSLEAHFMGAFHDFEPLCRIELVRAEIRSHIVVEDFGGSAG
jgi:hypothetical protein